jgi:hypothetical protein
VTASSVNLVMFPSHVHPAHTRSRGRVLIFIFACVIPCRKHVARGRAPRNVYNAIARGRVTASSVDLDMGPL